MNELDEKTDFKIQDKMYRQLRKSHIEIFTAISLTLNRERIEYEKKIAEQESINNDTKEIDLLSNQIKEKEKKINEYKQKIEERNNNRFKMPEAIRLKEQYYDVQIEKENKEYNAKSAIEKKLTAKQHEDIIRNYNLEKVNDQIIVRTNYNIDRKYADEIVQKIEIINKEKQELEQKLQLCKGIKPNTKENVIPLEELKNSLNDIKIKLEKARAEYQKAVDQLPRNAN